MTEYVATSSADVTLYLGDCVRAMELLPESSVDSIVTDPPYGLGFMGKAWDSLPPGPEFAEQALRVLKPGGHLLAFGGTRTWHRLAVVIEDAGFELRDSIAWLYGSGFPKSLDVSKAIDKAAGVERPVLKTIPDRWAGKGNVLQRSTQAEAESVNITAPATPEAERWQGWGTALKPAFEPVVVARKPLAGTVANNVLTYGTGALNIDGCRIGNGSESQGARSSDEPSFERRYTDAGAVTLAAKPGPRGGASNGRWPANVVLDEHQAGVLDGQSGVLTSGKVPPHHADNGKQSGTLGAYAGAPGRESYGDTGGASRFFYVAKAPQRERPKVDGVAHPTVKPLALMRWLVRLVTPPRGVVLEPFAGSGTTVEAALMEGFRCVAIEREESYLPLILHRVDRSALL